LWIVKSHLPREVTEIEFHGQASAHFLANLEHELRLSRHPVWLGLQMANMSAIYEYLGARPDQIPILWLAAPLTGLIIQPIIGHASDRTWGPLGRRRPRNHSRPS
jgi:hypothetical protein